MIITLRGNLALTLFLLGLLAGAVALVLTPREEEPQIVVPMVDVLVQAPGLSARQTERQVTVPLEKLLAQVPGVEHLYSVTHAGSTAVTLRFVVGADREDALLNSYNKLYSNRDQLPAPVTEWVLKPVEVDDVPILVVALWSSAPQRYGDFELRRIAEEFTTALQALPDTSEVRLIGGRPRTVRVLLDPEGLAARHTTIGDVAAALEISNVLQDAGSWTHEGHSIALEAGDVLRAVTALEDLVVNVVDGEPVYLRDVAGIVDGPGEADSYHWIAFAPPQGSTQAAPQQWPTVAISVAKQRGANAVSVSQDALDLLETLRRQLLPDDVHLTVLRDYGRTADEKVDSLASSLAFAVSTVVVFIGLFLGWRPAVVVGLAVPVCYGITLALDMLLGYTINRVTLFALILSLGLLVDDPITGVDNIARYLQQRGEALGERVAMAMREIRIPLVMSTVTIVVAFLPLAFITGMMGPYMAPMAFNVPVSVISSTLVAFLVTPWLASRLLRASPGDAGIGTATADHPYRRLMAPLLASRGRGQALLVVVGVLFVGAALLPAMRWVPLKLLPFDNRNEVQVLIDMPEDTSLEATAAHTRRVADAVLRMPEVDTVAAFIGEPSPVDFNGMVRRYYQRRAPHLAELRVVLVDKSGRRHQSHAVVLRLRELVAPLATDGVTLRVIEVPPGPPVLSTVVAEIYGEALAPYDRQHEAAVVLMERLSREAHVVEVDTSLAAPRERLRFVTDKQKAALSGVSTRDIADVLAAANAGLVAGYLQQEREQRPLPIELRLSPGQRASRADFERLQVRGRAGVVKESSPQGLEVAPQPLVAVAELGSFARQQVDAPILHKDLRPVVYVTAEISGRTPGEVIADVLADQGAAASASSAAWQQRSFFASGAGDGWQLPPGTFVSFAGEGELRVTLDVFRDMGLGYLFALLAIFVVLRAQTGSSALSLIIMLAIPLTIIGIMPGFWLMNQLGERVVAGAPDPVLFTATAMIGMIALAGIVVRNSLILVEFISQARAAGMAVREAVLEAGAVRMRPVLLTAGTTLLGNLVITLDPVFNGLALAIIFGIVASTVFTLMVVPIVYLRVFEAGEGTRTPASAALEESLP